MNSTQSYPPFDTLAKIRELTSELLDERAWLARYERAGEAEAAAASRETIRDLERKIARLEANIRAQS